MEIFLSQSKKQRKRQPETVDSGRTFRSVFKIFERDEKKGELKKKERKKGKRKQGTRGAGEMIVRWTNL